MRYGDNDSNWHLDKKVPITLIAAIMGQTFGFGVWAESLSARLDSLERLNPSMTAQLAKLDGAREQAALQLNSVQGDIKALLDFARRSERRSADKDIRDMPHAP